MNSQVHHPSMIVTRFAPSPTGFLHIGGARTALFNALFAKRHGGVFKLRIEDTDRARYSEEAVAAIADGLAWLGLEWNGVPVSQHARAARHVEIVEALVANGAAFRCYCTAEETEALREQAFKEGRALRSPWRDGGDAPDTPYTVRFRAPDSDVVVNDAVQGEVRWNTKEFDDLVLLRADGTPTYNLAVVVDDHDMGVTHVIRGDDHLVNAGRQTQIYQALDWDVPQFAHIPLIHGPDGKKLSKRHGALGVEAYRDMGYLPEGLRNYLLRLGWAHGDKELFTDAEMAELFDLEGLGKAPARLDLDKMAHINAFHMKRADDVRLVELLWARIGAREDLRTDDAARVWVSNAIGLLKERASTLAELEDQVYFLVRPRPFELSGKAGKALKGDALDRLSRLRAVLAETEPWTEAALGEALQRFAEAEAVGFGKVGQPLRAALTGGAPAPDMSFVLAVLGREEVLARLDDVI
ncbi:MAG: glutamate--tRNA ligase [Oceanicaulis sp.]